MPIDEIDPQELEAIFNRHYQTYRIADLGKFEANVFKNLENAKEWIVENKQLLDTPIKLIKVE